MTLVRKGYDSTICYRDSHGSLPNIYIRRGHCIEVYTSEPGPLYAQEHVGLYGLPFASKLAQKR